MKGRACAYVTVAGPSVETCEARTTYYLCVTGSNLSPLDSSKPWIQGLPCSLTRLLPFSWEPFQSLCHHVSSKVQMQPQHQSITAFVRKGPTAPTFRASIRATTMPSKHAA